jgi:hypothetical protein
MDEVLPHCDFDLHIPDASDVQHLFMYFLAVHVSSLEKSLFHSQPNLTIMFHL